MHLFFKFLFFLLNFWSSWYSIYTVHYCMVLHNICCPFLCVNCCDVFLRWIEPKTLESLLSISFKLLPALASTGLGVFAWWILGFGNQLSVQYITSSQGVSIMYVSPRGFKPRARLPLIPIVKSLLQNAEGTTDIQKCLQCPNWCH